MWLLCGICTGWGTQLQLGKSGGNCTLSQFRDLCLIDGNRCLICENCVLKSVSEAIIPEWMMALLPFFFFFSQNTSSCPFDGVQWRARKRSGDITELDEGKERVTQVSQHVCVCVCAHGIFQTRILEHIAISSSRGSSPPRDRTQGSCVSCTGRQILYHWVTWEATFQYLRGCWPEVNTITRRFHDHMGVLGFINTFQLVFPAY